MPAQCAKRGYDPKKVLAEYAECLALADRLGLVLDSDPHKVSQAGLTQPRPTEETTPQKGAS